MGKDSMKPILRCCVLPWAVLLIAGMAESAHADVNADKAAISARLHGWAAAFNARDIAGTCDLFARTLISTVQGAPDADRNAVCARLTEQLANHNMRLHYRPDIREIIVSADIAVVRLNWTLTVQKGTERHTSSEAGMDIFQKQPDGVWSIIRFLSFPIDVDRDEESN
jgi:uncharacterized protein (TIGR02246 family)